MIAMKNTDLSQLRPAQRAVVTGVEINSSASQRLSMLGVLPGVMVEMVRYAPLGDPLTFALNGQQFSLRVADAKAVKVRLEQA